MGDIAPLVFEQGTDPASQGASLPSGSCPSSGKEKGKEGREAEEGRGQRRREPAGARGRKMEVPGKTAFPLELGSTNPQAFSSH